MTPSNSYIITLLGIFLQVNITHAQNVRSEAMKGVDFSTFKTYAWLPSNDSIVDIEVNRELMIKAIVESANIELQNRGLIIDADNPDALVRYDAMVGKKQTYVNDPVYSNPRVGVGFGFGSWGSGMSVNVSSPVQVGNQMKPVTKLEGSLVVDLIDYHTKQVVWRGWAKAVRDDKGELINIEERVKIVMPKIFKKFPVKKKKKKK